MSDITKEMKPCSTPGCGGYAWAAKGFSYCTKCHSAPPVCAGNSYNFSSPANSCHFVTNPICAMPGCSEYAPKDVVFSFAPSTGRDEGMAHPASAPLSAQGM